MGKAKNFKDLTSLTDEELIAELARRQAQRLPENFTMSDVELAVVGAREEGELPKIAAMLSRMKPEKPTAKACPRCGKRTPVRAKDRERTVQSLAGPVTFRRNYHYCESCHYGFYPVDRLLDLPEEGELTAELEKRVLDMAINGPFDQISERWSVHYPRPISANLARQVVRRLGAQCESVDEQVLQQELMAPPVTPTTTLIVQTDGSMLPMRGDEPWKEAKVAVLVRSESHAQTATHRGYVSQARYLAVLGDQEEFAASLEQALAVEDAIHAGTVAWLGDGAPENWTLARRFKRSNYVEILDCQHAVGNGMVAGRALLGEESTLLEVWKSRIEQLVYAGRPEDLIRELLECIQEADSSALPALNDLVRYYRNNASRMNYPEYILRGLPIGSGIVESAHRHVLQSRMKLAGQHWSRRGARHMARLRAAYRTAGALRFYGSIRSAVRRPRVPTPPPNPRRRGLRLTERRGGYVRRRASNYGTTGVRIPSRRRRKPSN